MSKEALHNQILTLSPPKNQHDFVLYTDGAGWQDSFGASASLMESERYGHKIIRVASFHGQSTDRAEFEAMLNGMQSIMEVMNWTKPGIAEKLRKQLIKPSVYWMSDRESLVLSVYRDSTGQTLYKRRSQPDLWKRFEFYEERLAITPVYIPRDTNDKHNLCDRLASESRSVMKDYIDLLRENGVIPENIKHQKSYEKQMDISTQDFKEI